MIDANLLQEIVNRILTVSKPDRIILFGSSATGRAAPDSDIDLLILEREVANPREASLTIRDALRGLRTPFDVVVMSTGRYDETKHVVGGIAYPANKYGKVLYEVA
ncbi:MAG: nucleotidyltransferase domain-containing protein [Acidobacteriota bacterium]